MDGTQLQGQGAGQPVLGDELLLLGQQGQHGLHILLLAGDCHRLGVLPLLVLRRFLLKQVREGVVPTVLLKVGTGNTTRIILRAQVVGLADLRAVIALDDGCRVADLQRQRGGAQDGQQKDCQQREDCHSLHDDDRLLFFDFIWCVSFPF